MILKNQKFSEINDLMNDHNIDIAMNAGVLELIDVVEITNPSTEHRIAHITTQSFTKNSEDTEFSNSLKELGINDNMKSIVDLVVKNEIKKWLNHYLPQIVKSEVKKAIENIVSNKKK